MLSRLKRLMRVGRGIPNRFGLQSDLLPPSDDLHPHDPKQEDERQFVFLSHTSRDQLDVEQIVVPILRSEFLDYHLANRSQKEQVANLYRHEILRSLSRCRYFLVFVTTAALELRVGAVRDGLGRNVPET